MHSNCTFWWVTASRQNITCTLPSSSMHWRATQVQHFPIIERSSVPTPTHKLFLVYACIAVSMHSLFDNTIFISIPHCNQFTLHPNANSTTVLLPCTGGDVHTEQLRPPKCANISDLHIPIPGKRIIAFAKKERGSEIQLQYIGMRIGRVLWRWCIVVFSSCV